MPLYDLNEQRLDISFFTYFLAFYGFIDSTAEDMTGNREREGKWRAAKGPGPGVEPGSAAEPRHMGHTLYQLS